MERFEKDAKNVVIDTNVIFSAMVKENGFVRGFLIFIKNVEKLNIFIPKLLLREIRMNKRYIARKTGITEDRLNSIFRELLKGMVIVDEKEFLEEIEMCMKSGVAHRGDIVFAALAIKKRPSILFTYNLKHYNKEHLLKLDVNVITPRQYMRERRTSIEYTSREKLRRNMMKFLRILKFKKK